MRRLSLLRHAKSSWGDPSLDDFYRPLNDRGRRSAKAMGEYLARHGARFDLILASPAERVVQTLKGLNKGGWGGGTVQFEQRIYDASPSDLLDLIRSVPDKVQSLLLVGHNPGIGMLAGRLAREDAEGLRASAVAKYPTGSLSQLELDVDNWNEVTSDCGVLTAFVQPRSLLPD
jgi:phosphohistidine phosphatase